MSRVTKHIRSNVVGYAALFVALSGTAYAVDGPLAGQNTVGSADVINNEVSSADIKDANVAAADIRSGSVSTGKLLDGDVRGIDVLDNTLTGADVDESTLNRPIYAKVDANGNIVPGESEGMGGTTIRKPSGTTGIYCFDNLPIDAKSAMATSINSAINTGVIVAASGGWPNDCVEGEEAKVEQRVTSTLDPIDQIFVVWFTD